MLPSQTVQVFTYEVLYSSPSQSFRIFFSSTARAYTSTTRRCAMQGKHDARAVSKRAQILACESRCSKAGPCTAPYHGGSWRRHVGQDAPNGARIVRNTAQNIENLLKHLQKCPQYKIWQFWDCSETISHISHKLVLFASHKVNTKKKMRRPKPKFPFNIRK